MRILVTGASGCVGHYICEELIKNTSHELYLLVRNPQKLQVETNYRSGINVIKGDMMNIADYRDLLSTIDVAVLTAAGWGGAAAFDINYTKTHELLTLLNPDRCQQVIYFATESILNRNNELLPEAGTIGTDYIRSKYQCFSTLNQLKIYPKITTVFPSLVFGGDAKKPYSHLSGGLPEVTKWVGLLRWFTADGSFHFIHGKDIATVINYLIEHPEVSPQYDRKLVLGNKRITADAAIQEICRHLGKPSIFRIPLSMTLAKFFIKIFNIQMAEWDYFCLNYRHFTHDNVVNPATFNLPTYAPTATDLLSDIGL